MSTRTWGLVAAGVAVLAAGAVAVAFASDWGEGRKHKRGDGPRGGGTMHLIQYDADKDGRITRAEVDAGIDAEFKRADTNTDGKLDAAEFLTFSEKRKAERKARVDAWRAKREAEGGNVRERPPGGPDRNFDPMKRMDWNLDGAISPDEFAGKTRAQAMRADRDGDGTILVEDLKKRGHGKRGEGERARP